MATRVTFDASSVLKITANTDRQLSNPQPALKELHIYMMGQTDRTFRNLKRGGHYRGVTWPPFSKHYKVRPSGKPVTAASHLLRDTGRLSAAAGQTRRWFAGGLGLEMRTEGVEYGAKQAARRPYLFFALPADMNVAEEIYLDHIEKQ